MALSFKAPDNLRHLVKAAFTKALDGGDLHYFPSQVTILRINSIPFQLRYAPSLASKPKSSSPGGDPFLNPPPSLYISPLGPEHFLVLNKFAITREHFILATVRDKPQTHLLEESDMAALLACMRADQDLFAFFNSGPASGASQPHRHIQLVPRDRMSEGCEGSGWTLLAADVEALAKAPLTTFAERVELHDMHPKQLREAYLRLYRRACAAVEQGLLDDEGEARISYNLAMTRDTLVVWPRTADGAEVRGQGGFVGSLSLNGTLLAGTALVKSEAEWEALRTDPDLLRGVLERVGVPREQSNL